MEEDFPGNDRFTIIRRLGAGGMGIVYEAQDNERQTRVALKTLRNIDPASIFRFKVEFRSLAELSHKNLLPLYELFFEDNHWFFTMELLEGATDLLTFLRGERPRHRHSDTDVGAVGKSAPWANVDSDAPTLQTPLPSSQASEATALATPSMISPLVVEPSKSDLCLF